MPRDSQWRRNGGAKEAFFIDSDSPTRMRSREKNEPEIRHRQASDWPAAAAAAAGTYDGPKTSTKSCRP